MEIEFFELIIDEWSYVNHAGFFSLKLSDFTATSWYVNFKARAKSLNNSNWAEILPVK